RLLERVAGILLVGEQAEDIAKQVVLMPNQQPDQLFRVCSVRHGRLVMSPPVAIPRRLSPFPARRPHCARQIAETHRPNLALLARWPGNSPKGSRLSRSRIIR